jgi:bidirectional [NiFe] hydrogenase diaphorase subunit
VVCTGTACYIKGATGLIKAVDEVAHIKPGETTPDNKLSVVTARCLGACGLAPAVVFDGEVAGKLEADDVKFRIRRWLGHDA